MRSFSIKPTRAYGVMSIVFVTVVTAVFGIILATQAQAKSQAEEAAPGNRLISIHEGGNTRGILTDGRTLREAFAKAGITIDKNDLVEPGLDQELVASQYDVNVYRARALTIKDGSVRKRVVTPYQTTEQIARHAGVTLQDEDVATLAAMVDLSSHSSGIEMIIDRATPFTFVMYGKKIQAYSQAETVGEMLKGKDITLGDKDALSVSGDTPLEAGMTVELWREGKQVITEDEKVDFPVEQIRDAARPVGFKEVKTPGEKGERTVSYEIEMKNGQEVSRKEIRSVTIKDPKKEVEIIGAKVEGPQAIMDKIRAASAAKGIDAQRVLLIAKCESGFNPTADSGYYKGIFQHDPGYWAARAKSFGYEGASYFDVDAQIGVSTGMMAGGGWSHWGCDPGPQ